MKNILNLKKKEESYKKGIIKEIDGISPSYINLKNPKYVEIDNVYYTGLIVVNYYREYNELLLKKLIDTNINMNISMYYEKQDTYKAIRDLTYNIGNVGVNVKEKNQNRQDIEVAAFTYNDAKYIRKEMQINNEELYFLYMYIVVYSSDLNELGYLVTKIEGLLESMGMQTKNANFRQKEVLTACIPTCINNTTIKNAARRNVLTSGLLSTYPFITSSIYDENGVFIGTNMYNDSLIFIDKYNSERYKNANMCVFGTSGSGKSFFTKLMILRHAMLDIEQYVIDPEREYISIGEYLDGTILKIGANSETFINVMDIREESIEETKGYLATKISKLIGFFNLIFGELSEEDKGILEEKLIECYNQKGITFDDETLYKKDTEDKIHIIPAFKESNEMPILGDLYNILEKDDRTKKFYIKLIPFVKGSLSFFNNHTNVELNNKLIIADVYDLGEENLKYGMYLFTELFWDKIKKNREIRKAIYLDEIWRLIGVTSNKEVASFIYKIFKTIRKYGGSAVAITQDVSDLFSLDDGVYGTSIINNSSLKAFFYMEEESIRIIQKVAHMTKIERIETKSLKRGETLMFVGDEHILAKINASDIEKNIIENKVIT